MSNDNYRKSISVKGNSSEAYIALTSGIEHWWTKPDAPITLVGDRAKFTFPPGLSYWVFEAKKLIPNSCVEALHLHEGQPKEIEKEWLSTRVIFDIESNGAETLIHFEHVGLNPTLLCHDICEAGWDFFFLSSLKSYLDTGEGKPHRENA